MTDVIKHTVFSMQSLLADELSIEYESGKHLKFMAVQKLNALEPVKSYLTNFPCTERM